MVKYCRFHSSPMLDFASVKAWEFPSFRLNLKISTRLFESKESRVKVDSFFPKVAIWGLQKKCVIQIFQIFLSKFWSYPEKSLGQSARSYLELLKSLISEIKIWETFSIFFKEISKIPRNRDFIAGQSLATPPPFSVDCATQICEISVFLSLSNWYLFSQRKKISRNSAWVVKQKILQSEDRT